MAYMASVVVDGEQFKTYPQTFASQVIQMFVDSGDINRVS